LTSQWKHRGKVCHCTTCSSPNLTLSTHMQPFAVVGFMHHFSRRSFHFPLFIINGQQQLSIIEKNMSVTYIKWILFGNFTSLQANDQMFNILSFWFFFN